MATDSRPATSPAGASSQSLARTDAAGSAGASAKEGATAVILGGGPIGLVCALLLARQGFAIQLVDARPLEALRRDRRLLALSRGTIGVLESLLGRGFAPTAPIEHVHVSSRGDPGATHLRARDFGGVALGATVWYADLVDALSRAAQEQARIDIARPHRALQTLQRPDRVRVVLDDGCALEAALAIDAEGSPPRLREPEDYALLADLDVTQGRPGDAIERFTREGPLALLPLPGAAFGDGAPSPGGPQDAGVQRRGTARMSMIWCLPASLARARMALADAQLLELICRALGPRIGRATAIGERSMFPLLAHRLDRVCEHRLVHLGNAAQSLHPVAGQGFNLGIRDCVCLVECLIESATTDPGDPLAALTKYSARRRLDRAIVPALTRALPRVFSSTLAPVVVARSAALLALDLVPGLRRGFTRLLMFGVPG